jgi:hypothetical protein
VRPKADFVVYVERMELQGASRDQFSLAGPEVQRIDILVISAVRDPILSFFSNGYAWGGV